MRRTAARTTCGSWYAQHPSTPTPATTGKTVRARRCCSTPTTTASFPRRTPDFTNSDFTIEAWCTQRSTNSSFIATDCDQSAPGFMFGYNGGMFGLNLSSSAESWDIMASEVPESAWSHVAATRSGNLFTVFINGEVVVSEAYAVTDTSGGDLFIGNRSTCCDSGGTPAQPWRGNIASLRISDTARYKRRSVPRTI